MGDGRPYIPQRVDWDRADVLVHDASSLGFAPDDFFERVRWTAVRRRGAGDSTVGWDQETGTMS
jgi:hypothetical protein